MSRLCHLLGEQEHHPWRRALEMSQEAAAADLREDFGVERAGPRVSQAAYLDGPSLSHSP